MLSVNRKFVFRKQAYHDQNEHKTNGIADLNNDIKETKAPASLPSMPPEHINNHSFFIFTPHAWNVRSESRKRTRDKEKNVLRHKCVLPLCLFWQSLPYTLALRQQIFSNSTARFK